MKNSFAAIGKNVVQTEIDALKKLKKSINKDFDKIVNVILKCKGKIVFSGVGKSGIVSKNIINTFIDWIPTFYVDAGSCSHGDLGMISSNDVIILISHSGESEELKNIIKYAKRNRKITLIGITSKKNSLLYKSSNIKIFITNYYRSRAWKLYSNIKYNYSNVFGRCFSPINNKTKKIFKT